MTKRNVQFSIMFFAASEETLGDDKYRLVLDAARFADQHGFSSVWIPERHFASLGGLYPNPAVLHAALAVATSRIQLRAGSVVLPLHHPLRAAEEWAVVDNLSSGRVGVSFASGWNPDDFALNPGKYEHRSQELLHSVGIVQKLWRGEALGVTNGLGQQVEVRIYPKPVQRELPTWITAARSPATFVQAGETGANVLTHLLDQDVEDVAEKIALYRQARASRGYDPKTGVVTIMLHTFVGGDMEAVREQGRKGYCEFLKSNASLLKALAASRRQQIDLDTLSPAERDDFVNLIYDRFASKRSLIGTPETCFDLAVRLRGIDVDEIACLLDFGPPYDLVLENLPYLNRLRERCASEEFQRAVDGLDPQGQVEAAGLPLAVETSDHLRLIRERCGELANASAFYASLRHSGLSVPRSLQRVVEVWRRDGEALAEVSCDGGSVGSADASTAEILDSCLHASLAALPSAMTAGDGGLWIPWQLPSVVLRTPLGARVFAHVLLRSEGPPGSKEIEGELRILSDRGESIATVPRFLLRRAEVARVREGVLDRLSYELRWETVELPVHDAARNRAWIVVCDSGGLGHALAGKLRARGTDVVVIEPQAPAAIADTVDAEKWFESITAAVRDALHTVGREALVVLLTPLDALAPDDTSHESLRAAQVRGSGCAAALIRSLSELPRPPQLVLVTRGSQCITEQSVSAHITQAPVWGLGRTCAIEHPELWGGLVDLDPAASNDVDAAHLIAAADSTEDQIAFRNGETRVPRLVRGRPIEPHRARLRSDGAYLVTGGLKGIGVEVARWLVSKGARQLVLIGRTPLPPRDTWDELEGGSTAREEVDKIRALQAHGAEVMYGALDVADATALNAFLGSLRSRGYTIRGVIHAASVWRDERGGSLIRPLATLDYAAVEQVFRPKVSGSWALHRAFEGVPLDFFVLFSSAASLTGSAGQGNYAAASAFLDALADYRIERGQPALSVNWGPISGAGFGATAEGLKVHEYWSAYGLRRCTVEQLLEALESLLPLSLSRFAVMDVDWTALSRVFPALAEAPWARALVPQTAAALENEEAAFVETMRQIPAEERLHALVDHVREHVAAVMGLDRLPDPRRKLFEMGMDSLMAVTLRNRLERSLGRAIRVTAIFNYPTIESLSAHVLEELFPAATPAATVPTTADAPAGEGALSRIKAMTDEEIDRLLGANTKNW